jgi:hypothetical protein
MRSPALGSALSLTSVVVVELGNQLWIGKRPDRPGACAEYGVRKVGTGTRVNESPSGLARGSESWSGNLDANHSGGPQACATARPRDYKKLLDSDVLRQSAQQTTLAWSEIPRRYRQAIRIHPPRYFQL